MDESTGGWLKPYRSGYVAAHMHNHRTTNEKQSTTNDPPGAPAPGARPFYPPAGGCVNDFFPPQDRRSLGL